jgi:ABC-type sugar transport system substrate-binding protein
MSKLKFVVSLTNNDNDYQIEQAKTAQNAARRLGIEVEIVHAGNDAIAQSQKLLQIIQSPASQRPNGIVVEPVGGTGLPQVAKAAVTAGIGWVLLNREDAYLTDLRQAYSVPTFCITSDHEEIGRVQGQQLKTLLPKGGSVLSIQGPTESLAAKQRTSGMQNGLPANIEVKAIRGQWTEASAHKAVASWLRLSTSRKSLVDVIAAQDDSMAVGAKKAFQELPTPERDRWMSLPFLGVDGVPDTGQAWVKSGLLTATIIVPANAGQAVEKLAQAMQTGTMPAQKILIAPLSFPPVERLQSNRAVRGQSASGSKF